MDIELRADSASRSSHNFSEKEPSKFSVSRLEIGFIFIAVALLTVVITRGNSKPVESASFVLAGSSLKRPSDINAFVKFPEDTKSLLSKYLTPEVYEAYKG